MPFVFTLTPDQLNDGNWMSKAIEVGAGDVPAPPAAQLQAAPTALIDYIPEDQAGISRYGKIDFEVPQGYWLESAEATATTAHWPSLAWSWQWLNGNNTGHMSGPQAGVFKGDLFSYRFRSGPMSATYGYRGISFGTLTLLLTFGRTPTALDTWRQAAWVAIRAAALARYQEHVARAQEERDRLWRLLNGKDTLSLRRIEREELMRLVMSWLLGPSSKLKAGGLDVPLPQPSNPVQMTVGQMLENEQKFQTDNLNTFFPTLTGVSELEAYDALLFGEFVKFLHQAVEWENILYFLYPYFWGSEVVGREKLLFEHADPEHERFLRAGYARIVLPVRPGFEEEFTRLVETGTLAGHLTSPYLPIAQEIANFARTNYAGIPPANPELHARPLLFPEQRATWDIMQDVMKKVDAFNTANGKYPGKLGDLPSGEPRDAWGNPFVYRTPGLGADYDLVSLGADNAVGGDGLNADISSAAGASLVATWFDYTPTSALDIELDTKPDAIA